MSENESTGTSPSAESAGTVDGSAGSAPIAESAPPSSRPTVDVDKLLEQAAKASNSAREATRRAEAAEKARKDESAELEAFRALKAEVGTNKRAAIRKLIGEGYKAQEIIEELSLDVEPSTDAPVPEQIAAALKKRDEQAAKDAEAAEAKRKADAQAAREAEAKTVQNEFLKEVDAFTDLPENAEKFPLSAAWADEITPELVLSKFKELLKAGQPCEPPDVMAAIEAKFRAKVDRATGKDKVAAQADAGPKSVYDEINERLAALEAEERAASGEQPIKRADPLAPKPDPVPPGHSGKSIHDENLEFLAKLDRENNPAFRLGHG